MCQMGARFFGDKMNKLKKATTFHEQIELLKEKNIVIDDEPACIEFLKQVNYYRLSGYYLPYMDRKKNQCFKPTKFSRIHATYEFDAKLRSLILSAVETIEVYLRSQLSQYHSIKYGPEGYMSPSAFRSNFDHSVFLDRIQQCKDENRKSHIVMHHNNKYGGHFPLWVIIEFFSVGMLSYFYKGMQNIDKTYLSSLLYGTNYQSLESWLRCLTDLRNCCAHYSRIYYRKFSALPKIPEPVDYIPTRRVFSQICVLKFLYPGIEQWRKNFYTPLKCLIDEYGSSISLNHLDFPPDKWEEILHEKTPATEACG